jgi:hypothetical protein
MTDICDAGKKVFQVRGADATGAVVFRKESAPDKRVAILYNPSARGASREKRAK